ncbi:MAG: glycoside hydrolase family 3 C-terminal domain-containing protein, partial [Microbacteriaceae bacterium]
VDAFGAPLREAVQDGRVPESLVDRALLRVLEQKISIGLLDDPTAIRADATPVLDDDASCGLARRLARESLVLLENRDALPLAPTARLAVVGPLADEASAMLGCYSFPAHVGSKHPEVPIGITIPTVLESLRAAGHEAVHATGSTVDTDDRSGFAAAVAAAQAADVAIAVVGDRAGLFGRGTSGEGCDAADLRLPGVQRELLEALLETGTPVVIVLLTGRPYALGGLAERAAAVLQGFFPGQEGGPAIAEILTGAVAPSGRLPVGIPRDAGSQPGTYLSAPLGQRSGVSNIDPTPLYPFGHGLGYSRVEWSEAEIVGGGAEWPVDGAVEVAVTLRNAGDRPAADVVQLYAHDPVAQVTRPVQRLIGFRRVELQPGESARVVLRVHADLLAFTGLAGRRVVEPGAVQLRVARSSAEVVTALDLVSTGPLREVGHDRELLATATVETLEGALA